MLKVGDVPYFNFKCNSIFYFIYIYSYWRTISHCLMFFKIHSKLSWISDKECDLSDNLNLLFHVGAEILNLFCFAWLFYIFPCTVEAKIWESNKFVLSGRFSNSLWGSDSLLFPKFVNIVSMLFYNYLEFIILLDTSLVISFGRYKEYMICWISFSKFR